MTQNIEIEHITIPNDLVPLEGKIWKDKTTSNLNNRIGIILCHPHPLFYGTMDDHVIHSLFLTFTKEKIPILKFNFRGVNNSLGTYGNGLGEKKDVKSAIKYFKEQTNVEQIVLIGYSFGSLVGYAVLEEDTAIAGFCGISYPAGLKKLEKTKEFSVDTTLFKKINSKKPKLFVIGDIDDFTTIEEFKKEMARIDDLKEVKIVPGVNHFWSEKVQELSEICLNWVKENFLK